MNELREFVQHPLEVLCAATGYLAAPTSAFLGTYFLSNNAIVGAVAGVATLVDIPVNPLSPESMPSIARHFAFGAYAFGTVLREIIETVIPRGRRIPEEPLEQVLRSSKHWKEPR